jgi:hypothetical protein
MQDIEIILNNIRSNASLLSNYHRKRYIKLKSRLKYYRLPIIVISALNSVASVSLQPFIEQGYISLINMFLSLSCGIIGSIELFFGYSKQMELELSGSKEFYVLAVDIFKYLSLTPSNRSVDGVTFLAEAYSRYIKLIEASAILKTRIEDKLITLDVTTLTSHSSIQSFVSNSNADTDTISNSSLDNQI